MSTQLLAVVIGSIIGIIGSLATTMYITINSNRRRSRAIRAIAKGEIISIKEKAERFIKDKSSREGLGASTPLLTSIVTELGFLSEEQAIALRRAATLDMEMRSEATKEKAQLAVQACEEALKALYGYKMRYFLVYGADLVFDSIRSSIFAIATLSSESFLLSSENLLNPSLCPFSIFNNT